MSDSIQRANKPQDFPARQSALDIEKSWIVQAPAGSGKTGILVYRMLKLLAVAKQPEEVLAITFTRKAAKEMRDRLIELLTAADKQVTKQQTATQDSFEQQGIDLAKRVLEVDDKNDWQLLNLPHRLNIETIDALCARLVSIMPWLSQLGQRPKTTEKPGQHYQFAIEQLLMELLDEKSDTHTELKTLLLSQDNNFRKVKGLLEPMLSRRDQWLRHFLGQDLSGSREKLEGIWRNISEQMLRELLDTVPVGAKEDLVELAKFSAQQRIKQELDKHPADRKPEKMSFPSAVFVDDTRFPRADFSDIDLWLGIREMLLTKGRGGYGLRKAVTKTQGFPTDFPDEKERFKTVLANFDNAPEFIQKLSDIDKVPPAVFSDEQWSQILVLEKVLRKLLAHLQLRFHNAKECDFTEVSLRANRALNDLGRPTDLALRMDYQIQHILVDEFQDTSHAQFTLLQNLTRGWQHGDGRSLFLVGDPMQSIYRFREADVGLFVQLAQGRGSINDIQLEPLVLSENFRSKKTLVEWFNTVFTKSFPQSNDEVSGAITYSEATSNKVDGPAPQFDAFHSPEEEADHIVDLVNAAIKRGDKKIAILVRGRGQLSPILPALAAANIRYEGVDIRPLNSTQEVLDVISLCKAIVKVDDKVAWLSLLRGPWVGLSLEEITILTEGKNQIVWDNLQQPQRIAKLSPLAKNRINSFVKTMQKVMEQKQQVPLSELAFWAWQQLGGEQCLRDISKEDLAVVWSLIQRLETGGVIEKMTELDQALEGLFAQADLTTNGDGQRVIISTIHKSKGLQYDTVILPGLSRKGANNDKDLLRWAEVVDEYGNDNLLIAALASTSSKEQNNSHYFYLQELEKQRDVNEKLRLLYVACTRAETHLHMTGVFGHTKAGELTARGLKQSLLQGIWPQVIDNFKLEEREASEDKKAEEELIDQTLYRLPENFELNQNKSIDWQLPHEIKAKSQEDDIRYDWAGSIAQATGIVLHSWLEHHADSVLSFKVDESQKSQWRAEFLAMRLDSQQVQSAVKRMSIAVANMQKDPKAQWMFNEAELANVENEYALTSVDDGKVQHHIVDRTFIDKQGTRWVIDYKSTTHFEDNVSEFVDQQIIGRGYKAQLERYGKVFSQLEDRPIKLGIYFPLLNEWREWGFK